MIDRAGDGMTTHRYDEIEVIHYPNGMKTTRYFDRGRCVLEEEGFGDHIAEADDAWFGLAYLGFMVLVAGLIWLLWSIFA